jgi:hypothetical protein
MSEMSEMSALSDDISDNPISNNHADNRKSCCMSRLSDEIIVTEKSCCLKSEDNSNTVESCCKDKSNDNESNDSESSDIESSDNKKRESKCPCSLNDGYDVSRYFLKHIISSQQVLKEWKVDLYSLSFQFNQTTCGFVKVYQIKSFDTPNSRLPLRLHLLLLVLLN